MLEEMLKVCGTEVGDADAAASAELLGNLEGAPGFETLSLVVRGRVQEVEVEVIETELLEGVAKCVEGGLVTVIGVPKLGRDE